MSALEEFFGTADPVVLLSLVGFIFGLGLVTYVFVFADRERRRTRDRLDDMNRRMHGIDSRKAKQARGLTNFVLNSLRVPNVLFVLGLKVRYRIKLKA